VSSRRRLTGLVTAVALLLAAPAAHAFSDAPDAGAWITNGTVRAIAEHGDTTYIGGDFTYVGPRVGSAIALATSDASLQAFPEFAGGAVEALEPDGAGGWFVGGRFTHVAGAAHANLVHVMANGSLGPNLPQPNGPVEALALDAGNGRLYVGGEFTQIAGTARSKIGRILTATNTLDDTWDPGITGLGARVEALELHPSQAGSPFIWVGGTFDGGGAATSPNFVELRTDANTASGAYTTGTNGLVRDVDYEADKIYLGGSFSQVLGSGRNGIAALDFSTPALNGWNPNIMNGVSTGSITDLDVRGTGVVYVSGSFNKVGAATRNNVAAINDVPSGSATATGWDPNPSGNLSTFTTSGRSIAVAGSTVYVGGNFTTIGGEARNGLAAIDAATGVATGWDGNVANDPIALEVAGSTVAAGGAFTAAKGVRRANVAALDGSGAATSWNPGTGFNQSVAALAVAPSGSPIYIGGDFTSIDSQPRASIAAVDSAGHVTGWHPDTSGEIHALQVSPDGQTIFAGGNFSDLGGAPRESLGALSATSDSALPWDPHPNSNVHALLLRPDGSRLYVGGEFDNFGGGTTLRNSLAEFEVGNNTPTAFNPNPDSYVFALALSPDAGTLYFGGDFSTVGTTARNYVAAVDASGGLKPFDPHAPDGVRALAVSESGSTVFVGGTFDTGGTIGGAARGGIAEVDAGTGAATAWNPDTDGDVFALSRVGFDLQIGGEFSRVGSGAQTGFARFVGPRPPVVPISNSEPGPIPATPLAPPPDKTAPLLSLLSLTNKTFAVGPKSTALSAAKRKVKKGTTFRWTLSEAATSRIQIQQERRGIKKGKRCVAAKPGAKVPRKKRCTALQSKGTLRRASRQGRNTLAFSGRMGKKALKPGAYRAVFTATDAAGNGSVAKRLKFKIVRAR
jgi:hypothetical protein